MRYFCVDCNYDIFTHDEAMQHEYEAGHFVSGEVTPIYEIKEAENVGAGDETASSRSEESK